MFSIRSQRLLVRKALPKDLDVIWGASQIPGLCDGLLWVPPASKEVLAHDLSNERVGADWYPLVIVANEGGEFLGRIFLKKDGNKWFIGFWLLPDARGKGYATEALSALLDYAFKDLGLAEVYANCMLWNEASKRVIERLGMKMINPRSSVLKAGKSIPVEEFVIHKPVTI